MEWDAGMLRGQCERSGEGGTGAIHYWGEARPEE